MVVGWGEFLGLSLLDGVLLDRAWDWGIEWSEL